jgi:hypothetical protein
VVTVVISVLGRTIVVVEDAVEKEALAGNYLGFLVARLGCLRQVFDSAQQNDVHHVKCPTTHVTILPIQRSSDALSNNSK